MKKNWIKKSIVALAMLLCVMPSVNASTIIETTGEDNYDTIENNTIVIGVTKFESGEVITAGKVAEATYNYMKVYADNPNVEVPNIYYFLENAWYEFDDKNNTTLVEDTTILDELDIFFVNNEEKMLEIEIEYTCPDGYELIFKSNDEGKDSKIKYEDGIVAVPASVNEVNVFLKETATGNETLLDSLKKEENNSSIFESTVNNWKNKTAVFVGDSITYGSGTSKRYWEYLDTNLELSTVTNMGVNSSCVSTKSDYGTNNQPLINRYTTIPDADLISIFMGTNDYGHETPLGTINDSTDTSFYGALNIIIPQLKNSHPNSRIVFLTPIHRYGAGTSGILGTAYTYDNVPNGVGATLEDYVNAVKDVCAKYSIPVIDLYTLFDLDVTDTSVRSEYMPDGLHPNADGHQILADIIAKELKKIKPAEAIENKPTVDVSEITLQYGNDYGTTNIDSLNRASVTKNTYLEAGTIISLKEPTKFKYALYSQSYENLVFSSNITGGYTTNDYTVTTSGWYGFAFVKTDDSNFDLGGVDSNLLVDYIEFLEEPKTDLNVTLQIGNKYGASTATATNRATVIKNIYLKANTVISVKDASKYKYSLYNQNGETIEYASNITGGWTTNNYTITSDGWYGISIATVDDSNFDLGGTDSNIITAYINFGSYDETDSIVAMEYGNDFDPNQLDNKTRATAVKNIYLEKGTVISLKDSTTYNYAVSIQTAESVVANTEYLVVWTAEEVTITTDGYYGFTVKRVDNAELDLGVTDPDTITEYLNFEEPEKIETNLNQTMQHGNDFDTNYLNDKTRATAEKNIYLEKGTVISLKDSTTYNYAVSIQTAESVVANTEYLVVWTAEEVTITTDGYYGFTVKRVDNAELDLGVTDPDTITEYLNFEEPEKIETNLNQTMQYGNDFDTNYLNDKTRATAEKNIYLEKGTVISLKDSTTYNYAVNIQTDENIVLSTNWVTVWTTENVTIPSDGYYGLTVKRVDNAELDLGGTDSDTITGYLDFN